MLHKTGYIVSRQEDSIMVLVPMNKNELLFLDNQKALSCEVGFADDRAISPEQRAFIYSLIRAVSNVSGSNPEPTKEILKQSFCAETGAKMFSLSSVDMTTAAQFLRFLINFCLDYGVPTDMPLIDYADDIGQYVVACVKRNKCCITGRDGKLFSLRSNGCHIQVGDAVLPLSPEMTIELKTLGYSVFAKKYHIKAIIATEWLINLVSRLE